jgi:oligopeptide/dipeptide ABC transporter ATP-binding protein
VQSVRGDRMGMIFQNPFSSLHPQFRIGQQMTEPLIVRQGLTRREARLRAVGMLDRIGIESPEALLSRYSFEVSAGICQRVMLAIALMSGPELLIADEPTTNLDALAQAQILDLLKELRSDFHMSVLLITHDFGVVSRMADRIVVMYAGREVETGDAADVLAEPKHPYSIGLINSVPVPGQRRDRLPQIPGEVPDVMRLPPGCSFRPRCPSAMTVCREDPQTTSLTPRHSARCWLFSQARAA